MPIGVVFANTFKGVFSKSGTLPWNCPQDFKYFKNLTTGSPIVMGRKTAESLPGPLPNRDNYILSRSNHRLDGFQTITEDQMVQMSEERKIWLIGGVSVFTEFIPKYIDKINLISRTIIYEDIEEDDSVQYFNLDTDYFSKIFKKECFNLCSKASIEVYYRNENNVSQLDKDYLLFGKKILDEPIRETRNGLVRSSFLPNIVVSADFKEGFPILKTKNVWWKGVKEELLFFIDGKTNTKELEEKGINIWKGNTSEEFLKKSGKSNLLPGEMGPMYGFQWRHFGEKYVGSAFNYKGYDQLRYVIDTIIKDPNSRRILMTTYNPSQAEEGVLYPCHGLVTQFYVDNDIISLKTYQRSADWFLGVPFNISSYGLLLQYIVDLINKESKDTKYVSGTSTIVFGDSHIYEDHVPVFIAQYVNRFMSDKDLTIKAELDSYYNLINYTSERKFTAPMIS